MGGALPRDSGIPEGMCVCCVVILMPLVRPSRCNQSLPGLSTLVRAHPPLAPVRAHGHLQKGTHSVIRVLLTCVAPQLHVRLFPPPSSVGRLLKGILFKWGTFTEHDVISARI